MRKVKLWMLAAILSICGGVTLTSCSESIDHPVKPEPVTIDGLTTIEDMNKFLPQLPWLDISYYMMEENTFRVWTLKDDKTFIAYDLFYDDEGEFQVEESTGKWRPFIDGEKDWTLIETEQLVGFDAIYDEYSDAFGEESRTERFFLFPISEEGNGAFFISESAMDFLVATFNDDEQEVASARALTRAEAIGDSPLDVLSTVGTALTNINIQNVMNAETLQKLYNATMSQLNAAGKTEAGYNINAKTFTRDNWREQKFIYRYTGTGNMVDENGSAGYTREALPWAEDEAVSTHLPFNFCDDLQPANGWELVFNAIGTYDVKNRDFFAVYNKFTGLLRFFVFLNDLNVADANDHAWEVTLTKQLALRQNYKFGIPISQDIVNKEPLGLRGTDYGYIVSPWVDSKTNDGFAPPGGGWWAFDLDLSQYRPDFQTLNERIRMEMRVWSNSQVSLRGKLSAQIKEKNAPETMVTSLGGLVTKAKEAYGSITSLITNLTTGNWIGAITSTVAAAKGGYNVITSAAKVQAKYYGQEEPQPEYIVRQYVDGTIDTEGLISGSRTVSGMSTITYPLSQFDMANTTLGQGVWNLKTPPTLISLGLFTYNDPHKMSGLTTLFPQYGNDNKGVAYTLDPRSIDVVLNPNVFPKDQIEWKRVTAVCGVRKGTKHDSHNAFRNAIGLGNNEHPGDAYSGSVFTGVANDTPVYDYLYEADDKQGMSFVKCWENVDTYTLERGKAPHHLVGRGDDDYLLEPTQFSSSKWEDLYSNPNVSVEREALSPVWIPSYEVTVTVTVKLKDYDTPFVMSRIYLPNYRRYSAEDVDHRLREEHEKLDKWLAEQKADPTNKTEWQEYQVQHIKNQFNVVRPNYYDLQAVKFWLYRPKGWTASRGFEGEVADYLFDHSPYTKWFSSTAYQTNGQWIVDFASSSPCIVKSYTITVPNDVESHKGRNPQEWALYGKKQATDPNWALLDYRHTGVTPAHALPTVNSTTRTYDVPLQGVYSVYRLVVTQTVDPYTWYNWLGHSCWLSIADFDFTDVEIVYE